MSGPRREDRFVLAFNPKPHIVDRVRAQGFELVSVFPGPAPEHAAAVSALVIADAPEADAVVAALTGAGLRDRTVGAVTHNEPMLLPTAEVAERLGLPTNPLSVIETTVDKSAMRRLLGEDARFAVAHRVARGEADVADMIARHGAVVAKPPSGAGSEGVRVLRSAEAAAGLAFPLLVEEYLEGPEYSVEAISLAGTHRILGVTEKFLFPGTVVESGHLFPARLGPEESERIGAFVADFLDLLGVRMGVTHTEIKLGPRGPKIIETHTRTGGDHIGRLVQLATGVDPISLSIAVAAGGTPSVEPDQTYWATTRYRAFPEGKVARVAGLEVARHMPGVNHVESALETGAATRPPRHSLDRALGAVAVGRDPEEAIDNAERALDQVRVEFE